MEDRPMIAYLLDTCRSFFARPTLVVAAFVLPLASAIPAAADTDAEAPRRVVSLNGSWQIAAGGPDQQPAQFDRTIPVPGVVDMADPPFEKVGRNTQFADDGGHKFNMIRDPHYRGFWYRRTFTVDGDPPPVAVLKLAKAKFGAQVWLNGHDLGRHWPCYTPGYFDVRQYLNGDGQSNELIVFVGADPLAVGDRVANGFDFEKHSYLAGIYDDVTLTLTGSPCVVNVQVVPEIGESTARVVAELRNTGDRAAVTDVECEVRPYRGTAIAGQAKLAGVRIGPGQTRIVEARVPIRDCQLWTPETPHLYHLVTRTGSDALRTRFGMRQFLFDPQTTIGVLNGKPYYLRGSNVCYFRFEEDPLRAGKPWDEQWVRTLHRRFKSLHMNSLRYCIGFPPDLWYRIADEEGMIIQDEFPIWTLGEDAMTPVAAATLAEEYRDWMRDHWNHACVLIWDAQNECRFDKTRQAIGMVRDLDLSKRPWDNGWGKPHQPGDIMEDHPYQYARSMAQLHWNPQLKPLPGLDSVVDRYLKLGPAGPRPRIVNEYAWLWLRRDGQPTTLTRAGYAAYLPDADADTRRKFYARRLSAMTEALRASRRVAGVLYFCGLGHSWDGCATSDNFVDLDRLTFEPHFREHMQYVFAPVGVMLSVPDTCQAGQHIDADVVVFNDLDAPWSGDVDLSLPGGKTVTARDVSVPPYDRSQTTLKITAPDRPGPHEFTAKIVGTNNKPVLSRRLITITE
jgi:beta-galactosidase/beta-glucuronidase